MGAIIPWREAVTAAEPQFLALATAGARHLKFVQEAQHAVRLIEASDQLQKCTPDSIRQSVENVAAMGLSLNPQYQHAALIPRWNSKQKRTVCTAVPMYRGYIAAATRTKVVTNLWGNAVYKWDHFEQELGSEPKIIHRKGQKPADHGAVTLNDILYAYVCVEIAGSRYLKVTVLSADEIREVANRSESFNPKPRKGQDGSTYTPKPSGPWISDAGEMSVKTAFRRSQKTWPFQDTTDYQQLATAVRLDNESETMDWEPKNGEDGLVQSDQELGKINAAINDLGYTDSARERFVSKICRAYGVTSLAAIPAKHHNEVLHRIAEFAQKARGPEAPAGHSEHEERPAPPPASPDPGGSDSAGVLG